MGDVRIETLLAERRWLASLARALAGGTDRSGDVEQETWRAALEHPPRTAANLRGWLARVARNAARQILRREKRTARRERAASSPGPVPDPGDAVERMELRRRLAVAVAELPEPYRTAVILRYFEDVAPTAIARRLGVPAATVRSRIFRGVALLRERLDREQPGGRRAWLAIVVPLLRPGAPAPGAIGAAALTGVLVMNAKLKLGLVALLVLLLSAAVVSVAVRDEEAEPAPPSSALAPIPEPARGGSTAAEPVDAASEDAAPAARPKPDRPSLAANDRIAGRVVKENGSPAPGVVVMLGFSGGSFRVEHGSSFAVTDAEGRFSFPAVRGAPYALYPLRGQPGFFGHCDSDWHRVAGGTTDIVITARAGGRVLVRTVDEETGEPLPVTGCSVRWKHGGSLRSTWVGTLDYQIGRRKPAPGFEPAPDGPIGRRSSSVVLVGLPPESEVDPETTVSLYVSPYGEVHEPGGFTLEGHDLDRDLGERIVRLRRLPERGFTLCIDVRYEEGEPYTGEGRLWVYRGDYAVQEAEFRIVDGEARVGRLALGADRVSVRVEDRYGKLSDCPATAGAEAEISLVVPRRWTLVVDPRFDGEARRLRGVLSSSGEGPSTSFTAGRWPHVVHGGTPGRATLCLFEDDEKVAEERVDLALGGKALVQPKIPGREAEPAGAPAIAAAPEPAPLEPGGPGVLVGRVRLPDGSTPAGCPVQLGRFADPGDPPETRAWWETKSDAEGTFRFEGLPPGRYELWARPTGGLGRRVRFEVPESGAVEPVEITWDANGAIAVVVRGRGGEPLAGEEVGVTNPNTRVSGRAGIETALTDEKGRATLADLRPGRWTVTWLTEEGQRIEQTARVAGGETTTVTFDTTASATLSGRVLFADGAGPVQALLSLWRLPRSDVPIQCEIGRDGGFRVSGVLEGDYRISFQELTLPGYSCPLGVAKMRAGEDRSVDLRVPDTRVSGRVTRAETGAPLGRDEVSLSATRAVDGVYEGAMCWANEKGEFAFVGLGPGTWNLAVGPRVSGLGVVRREIEVPDSGRLEGLDIALPAK